MNDFFRFSDYDLFAYLASGLAALGVWDLALSTHLVLGATWNVNTAALTLAGAYVLGHLVATPAAWILQHHVTHGLLRSPSEVLVGTTPLAWRSWLRRTVLRTYYSPLDGSVRTRIRQNARGCSPHPTGEELFWCAFPLARDQPMTYGRMEAFLRLYGFCRNVAFVGIVGSIALFSTGANPTTAALLGLGGLGMFHRYLKFYRAYALEVLLALSYQDEP